MRKIVHISLLVSDYDKAIEFYTQKLGFELIEDTFQPEQNKRWVLVSPSKADGPSILLAQPSKEEQVAFVGNQTGGRVFLFLQTDDFWRDYETYRNNGILFVREPKTAEYGTVAVFQDLYGNLWDLIEYN